MFNTASTVCLVWLKVIHNTEQLFNLTIAMPVRNGAAKLVPKTPYFWVEYHLFGFCFNLVCFFFLSFFLSFFLMDQALFLEGGGANSVQGIFCMLCGFNALFSFSPSLLHKHIKQIGNFHYKLHTAVYYAPWPFDARWIPCTFIPFQVGVARFQLWEHLWSFWCKVAISCQVINGNWVSTEHRKQGHM